MAAGRAKPMVARPFEMRNSPGLTACQYSAAWNMWAPASTVAMVPAGVYSRAGSTSRGGLKDVGARAHRGDVPRGRVLAGDLHDPVWRESRHRDLESALALTTQAVHLDHLPVRVWRAEARRQLLEDEPEITHQLEGGSEIAPASRRCGGGCPHEAQDGRLIAPASRDHLHRIETERDDM